MEYRKLNTYNLEEAYNLYKRVIKNSHTYGWDENYPSFDMIKDDIISQGLVGLFENDKLIAVSYIGEREQLDHVLGWRYKLKKPSRIARICVEPSLQGRGIGKKFLTFIVEDLKSRGYDGMRIIVAKENKNALKMYNLFPFKNRGEHFDYGICWYKLELKFGEK